MAMRTKTTSLAAILMLLASANSLAGTIERISDDGSGNEGNCHSSTFHQGTSHFSEDGRFVTYWSCASNLLSPDLGFYDVYVFDRDLGIHERASVATDGTQANNHSYYPSISRDGRHVAFHSFATNLVTPDINSSNPDIYVRNMDTGVTERVSVASDGEQGNNGSYTPAISVDGRYVAFYSAASNLVASDANAEYDVFVHDRALGVTERVSVATNGSESNGSSSYPAVSGDGRFVAFFSYASNFATTDTNGSPDIFVHDRNTGVTERVSVASDGTQSNGHSYYPSISGDGRYVAFWSRASNLVTPDANGTHYDIFVHDRDTGVTERVSAASDGTQGNSSSYYPSISSDGRYVAFYSSATNLVAPDLNGSTSDIYVHDRHTGDTIRVSTAANGTQANNASWYGTLSPDGTLVAFTSTASNLVATGVNYSYTQVYAKETDLEPSGANSPPVAYANGPYTVNEGDSVTLDGTASADPDEDPLIYEWDFDYDGVVFNVDASGTATPGFSVVSLDGPATIKVALRVTDDSGAFDIDETDVTIDNLAPVADDIFVDQALVPIGTPVLASAGFTDAGTPDTHTATWDWGDGTTPGTVTQGAGNGSVEDLHTYSEPGVYTLELAVVDDDEGTDTVTYQYVVVYDPDGSFVTGGGTIQSPPGAYLLDTSLTGNANFGFVSKYKKGANVPTGHTEFQFHAAGMDFKSSEYQWLVVAGAKAQFKGTGTIKDVPGTFGFFLTAVDGEINGGGGIDKFRIKIWDASDDSILIYDNQVGAADDAEPVTALQSGSIVIHDRGKE